MGFLKKLLIFFLVIVVGCLIAVLVLPKNYEISESIEINAPQAKVFQTAKNLKAWIPFAMMGNTPSANMSKMKVPESMKKRMNQSNVTPGGMDMSGMDMSGMANKMQGFTQGLKMDFKVVKAESPGTIVYKIEGGPLSGVEPELALEKVDAKKTRVTVKEKYEFEGFFGSIKAYMAKKSSAKLHRQNLENLKKVCGG